MINSNRPGQAPALLVPESPSGGGKLLKNPKQLQKNPSCPEHWIAAAQHPQNRSAGVVASARWRYRRKHLSLLPGLLFKQARETPTRRNHPPAA